LRVPRRGQAVLGRQGCASHVKGVLATWLLVSGGETVGKLRAVVSRILLILMGEASFRRRRKSTLLFSVMSP